MIQLQPTHIGLDIAEQIMKELQPDTPIIISHEFLELINAILNESIGLKHAGLYRIANRILTLIPFKKEIFERIIKNQADDSIDIYLVHLICDGKHCYCRHFRKKCSSQIPHSHIMEYSKIII